MLSFAFALSAVLQTVCDGITFADSPSVTWASTEAFESSWNLPRDNERAFLVIGDTRIPVRNLYGAEGSIFKVSELSKAGLDITWDNQAKIAVVERGGVFIRIARGSKRVEVDLKEQQLTAYQGSTKFLKTNISSGRDNRTPKGDFVVGTKSRIHYSTLYNFAPMPFSVQVVGNVFIHGFSDVPAYPASHGCIRLPLAAAEPFYAWVERGTPIRIR